MARPIRQHSGCAKNQRRLMLFDLRVVLAACLATFLFAAVGLGLLAASRAPFKSPGAYAAKETGLPGPGLPKSLQYPLPVAEKPEVTGTIASAPETAPAPATMPAPAPESKAAPQAAREPSITSLIEQDKTLQPETPQETAKKEAAKKEAAKKAALKKKAHHVRRLPKQPAKENPPFSLFTNNNGGNAPAATR
jgi:hypothetical protein